MVGDAETSLKAPSYETSVTVTLDLKADPAKLETWLTDEDSEKSRGAFFITVRRLE